MREKAEFEKNLPSITDEAQFELRKKLLEERELKEWAEREEESKKEQEQKLQILIDTLRARENKAAVLAEARIDAVRQRKLNQRDRTFAEIHQQRIKVHRGLVKAREKVEAKPLKRVRSYVSICCAYKPSSFCF